MDRYDLAATIGGASGGSMAFSLVCYLADKLTWAAALFAFSVASFVFATWLEGSES